MNGQGSGSADRQRLAEELEALEYYNDVLAARLAHFETANEEFIPGRMVDRFHAGENPVGVWREHRGLSLAEVATAAGLTEAELSRIESGATEPGLRVMFKVARALRVEVDELVPWPQVDAAAT